MRSTLSCIRLRTRSAALLCCSCLLFCYSINAQSVQRGVIEGTVVNENGLPVPQAQVYALGSGPTITAIRYVETNKDGHFRLDRLRWDTFRVFAGKPSAGYPKLGFSFYDDHSTLASIGPSSPEATVIVRIGPPCGLLEVESVADAVTGNPIKDYQVTLRRAADPHRFMSGTFSSPILIPPNVDVLVEVSANRYITWPVAPMEKASSRIHLKSGERLNLRVILHRSE